jgi:hypothetical protein
MGRIFVVREALMSAQSRKAEMSRSHTDALVRNHAASTVYS